MSATDSDNSIDWLASDYEDNESEQEFDSNGKCSQTGAPMSPRGRPHLDPTKGGCQVKDCESNWSEVEEASSLGSPPGYVEKWDSNNELCKRQQGEKAPLQQALKRPRSSMEEEEDMERQLRSNVSEKNQLFSRKCLELQCYIHPLSSILNGLRSGRYRERLSSFQESVAMDRIQRIMGVLQNPCLGEKYMNIILKMEEMLKSWFPNVKLQDQVVVTQTEEAAPTKKLKLSPGITTAEVGPVTVSEPPACSKVLRVVDLTPAGAYSASNLKWLHTSPICSATAEHAQAVPRHLLPPRDKDLTQDNLVSSSTDSQSKTDSVPRGPPPRKINAPCLERLLKSTESIISRKGPSGQTDSSWS
ncbi:circadian-associated transcriptional repressor [Takifugu rubripes]|uniref:Circadian-associated transcriptional repressor-like n=2 Tax=Takifugu TaxID=31032 RepID=A0A3B5JXQ6_TAKRU|nr:circadian-associated transcriptional repressor-like [Takifugu rubripes]XP_011605685.1 circadian-associated transcriptional repressor-like [Takifugu rubripes]XP_056908145.1 circadian-associated transcriptional repressor [Takifugu flavidus]XP_056908146.1 circadian-associated transcriptional repressor [Takifugu flavidus]TWW75713.1 Circadian-associated transcriptional repressor [Takifugu flavidus]|eukprot:XP_011605684.1 PREDICTED: circadian-associated transcriptional repressor-like [Takifugu rubripes]